MSKYPWLALLLAASTLPVQAQGDNPPVAVMSLVWGVVNIKHVNEDYKPARWMEPLFVGDQVNAAGPGSKVLVTFFSDNHQEVAGTNSTTQVEDNDLKSLSGPPLRVDPPRNPFGSGGVQNPFVYTRRLVAADFQGGDMAQENAYAKATLRSGEPLIFGVAGPAAAKNFTVAITDPQNQPLLSDKGTANRLKMSTQKSNQLSKGSVYYWQATSSSGQTLVARYPFLFLTLPLEKWLKETVDNFNSLRQRNQLQRSDYTDYLLVSAQLMRVDDVLALCQEMAVMDPKNPRVFRALTRAYLTKGWPAHAKQAHDTEINLGAIDPIYP